MAENDLLGYDDCDERFTEGPVDTAEHVRQTLYHAASTQRGQDWELPERWGDIRRFLETGTRQALAAAQALAQNLATDLEETDPRGLSKVAYRVAQGVADELQAWTAEATVSGEVITADGTPQPLPQDADPVEEAAAFPADPGPVKPGVRTLRQFAVDAGLFPFWLLGPNTGRVVYTVGLLMDMSTEWLFQGIQQRFPLVCAPDALPWLGRTLGLVRGPFEPEDGYRLRLTKWLLLYKRQGTCGAIAEACAAYMTGPDGPPVVHVVQYDPGADGKPTRATWYTRFQDGREETSVEDPPNWDYDSADPDRPAGLATRDPRFWVIVQQDASLSVIFPQRQQSLTEVSDPTVANGFEAAENYTVSPFNRHLVRAIEEMRAAGSWIAGVFFYYGEINPGGVGSDYPDGAWFDVLNATTDGSRMPEEWCIVYLNRYAGDWQPPTNPYANYTPVESGALPSSPAPYP